MSMSNGNPPVGYGYGVPHNDPEEPAEQRQGSGGQEAQDRLGMLDRELPDEPMDPERRAEEIVVREQGVNSFAHAEEADRMERPPSVRDQATNETTGNLITDAVRGARDALTGNDTDEETRR